MANIDIIPVMAPYSTTTGSTTITYTLACPANKRLLLDTIEIEYGTAHASNVCNIKFEENGTGGSANIIPEFGNFRFTRIHLASWFPRAVEMEELDELTIVLVRSGADSTLVANIFYIQRAE